MVWLGDKDEGYLCEREEEQLNQWKKVIPIYADNITCDNNSTWF